MTVDPKIALRLQFLVRVVRKECKHLTATDQLGIHRIAGYFLRNQKRSSGRHHRRNGYTIGYNGVLPY